MKFKQTAVLGLSALLLGGYAMPPIATAASLGLNGQSGNQNHLTQVTDQSLLSALKPQKTETPEPEHPIQKKQGQKKPGLFGKLFSRHKHDKAVQPAKSVTVSVPLEQVHLAATPVDPALVKHATDHVSSEKHAAKSKHKSDRHERVKAKHHKEVDQKAATNKAKGKTKADQLVAKAIPVRPVFTVNPMMTVATNGSVLAASSKNTQKNAVMNPLITIASPQLDPLPANHDKDNGNVTTTPVSLLATHGETTPVVALQSSDAAHEVGMPIVPSSLPVTATAQLDPDQAAVLRDVEPIQAQVSPKARNLSSTVGTKSPAGPTKVHAVMPKPMMSISPLDRMMAMGQGAQRYTPVFDPGAGSPDISLGSNGSGEVKVLKSGVSQRMTSIDLAIGKAEVLYLSRPATRVSVSNPDVAAAVIISPTQIQLTGKAVGVANLLVWGDMNSPDHTVVDISVHRDVSVLVNQLKYVDPGIQIVPMAAEDTIILTGTSESRETAQLAIEMAKAFFAKAGGNMGAGPMPGGNSNGPNSQAPGSAQPGSATNVINLIKIKGEPSTKLELVRQRMQSVDPNIHVEVVPGPDGSEKVILTGRVPTASIASKALNLASVFYGQPGMKMVTSQGGNEFTKLSASSSSSSSSSGGSSSGGTSSSSTTGGASEGSGANVLQGSIMTDSTGNVISMLEIAQKPQIRCTIKFLELNKTALNALGGTLSGVSGTTKVASWSGVQSAAPGKGIAVLDTQSPPGSNWSTSNAITNRNSGTQSFAQSFREVYQNGITQAFTINNQLAGAIQALQERRQVRTLAEPTLMMLSGEQGSFLAGGEIPIAFVGGQGQVSIQYKEFGIRLNLLPNVTDDGKIQMQVAPEVSSLDSANGVSTNSISVPAFISRKMNTTLLVEQGQSFVLAGLYNQQDTDSMSRFPGLGSVPMLGSFFRNKWKNKTSSEMVVVIRPEIIYSNTGNTNPQPLSVNPMPKHELPN